MYNYCVYNGVTGISKSDVIVFSTGLFRSRMCSSFYMTMSEGGRVSVAGIDGTTIELRYMFLNPKPVGIAQRHPR